jgi:insulysin
MTVNSGYDKEDPKINGLAHFCEHMLFLGSKKYPKASHFIDYVSHHNGKFNGYTDFTNTAFFYKVSSSNFKQSLNIFARFFIDPLMSTEYVNKEVNAVDSEFRKNIGLDEKRKEMVLRELSAQDSVFSRFSTGNIDTLLNYTKNNGIDLKEKLEEYHSKFYRPDNIKLIIYGDKKPEYYKKLVEAAFDEMKEVNEPIVDNTVKPPFTKEQLGKLAFYKSISQSQELEIIFQLPDLFQLLPDNPALYFKLLINYKGENSLYDILRKSGLAAGIHCTVRKIYKGTWFLKLKSHITKTGIKEINKVIEIIFKYINLVKTKALDKELYDYVKEVKNFSFNYEQKKKQIMKILKELSSVVLNYDKKYYLAEHELLTDYHEKAIRDFGENLVLDNSIILLGNKDFQIASTSDYKTFLTDFDFSRITEKSAKFYETNYNAFKLADEFINTTNKSTFSEVNHIDLFPMRSPIPKHVNLLSICKGSMGRARCTKKFQSDDKDLTPTMVQKSETSELWFKQDRSYLLVKTNLFLRFIYDTDVSDHKYATQLRLLIFALNHHLSNFFYSESLRKTSFEIRANINGFTIKVFSYTDTLGDTITKLLDKVKTLVLSENEFELIKDEMNNELEAQLNLTPTTQAYVNFFDLILKDIVKNKELLANLEKLELKDFMEFYQKLFTKVYCKAFMHGSLSDTEAKEVFKPIYNLLSVQQDRINKEAISYLNSHADLSGYYIFREQLMDEHNVNHAIVNFYQIGPETIENMFSALLIKSLVGYITFKQLRMKEQLGYAAKGKVFSEGNVVYYLIYIQGNSKPPDYMDYRIENVIDEMKKLIQAVNDKKFEKAKDTIVKLVAKRDLSLKSRSLRLWDEIVTGRGYYDLETSYKSQASKITKIGLIKKFDEIFNSELKKLSIQEYNKNKIENYIVQKVRGFEPTILTKENEDLLRKRNHFVNFQEAKN